MYTIRRLRGMTLFQSELNTSKNSALCENYKLKEDEVLSDSGEEIICSVCGEVRSVKKYSPFLSKYYWSLSRSDSGYGCSCDIKRKQIALEQQRRDAFFSLWNSPLFQSFLGERYVHKTFSALKLPEGNESYKKAMDACMNYVKNFDIIFSQGMGMYLCSSQAGNGKSSLMACVRNALIDKEVATVFINYTDLLQLASSRFEAEERANKVFTFGGLCRCSVLILDDIGAEDLRANASRSSWINGFLYEILEKRTRDCLCTLFTSNWDIKELETKRGYDPKVVDRIQGASTRKYRIEGASFRGSQGELIR